jgi:uncharacterized protein YjiS (DUF1127 family)
MSAQTADSQFSFKLPSLSYIDAKWEEPNLRTLPGAQQPARKAGVNAWLARRADAFAAWLRKREAALALSAMSDRELADIGLTRSDLFRVFDSNLNQDLVQRGRR